MSVITWNAGWIRTNTGIPPATEFVTYADHVAAVAEAEVFARAGSRLRERDRIRQEVEALPICSCDGPDPDFDRRGNKYHADWCSIVRVLSIIDGVQPSEPCAGNSPSGLLAVRPAGQSADPERYKLRGES